MNTHFQDKILAATGAHNFFEIEVIQSLWSGYGEIIRYGLEGSSINTVIVKHVRLPSNDHHPRGWNTDLSHARKIRSYQVEMSWYKYWSERCDDACRVPRCLAYDVLDDEVLMVLEDLDAAGFPRRKSSVSTDDIFVCLSWLANFHAAFMGERPSHLWEIGTYWHLDTRPDELNALDDLALKQAAISIDQELQNSPFQTFVHGDAKLANFCFSEDSTHVAAVDFQYVGGGCGMKDVAYLIGSCLDEEGCQQWETQLLDHYFQALKTALSSKNKPVDSLSIEKNWRDLYPIAWTDFHRFIKGWSPDHWKINSYSERIARDVVSQLNG